MVEDPASKPTDSRQRVPRVPRTPPSGSIEEVIREAIARGDFDNLPGRGQPLNLEGDSRDENFFAQKLLKDAGYVPAWVVLLREIEREQSLLQQFVQQLRDRLGQARQKLANDPVLAQRLADEVKRRREEYATRLQALSRKILRFNLMVPIKEKQIMGIRLDEMLEEFDAIVG